LADCHTLRQNVHIKWLQFLLRISVVSASKLDL